MTQQNAAHPNLLLVGSPAFTARAALAVPLPAGLEDRLVALCRDYRCAGRAVLDAERVINDYGPHRIVKLNWNLLSPL